MTVDIIEQVVDILKGIWATGEIVSYLASRLLDESHELK